MIKGKKVCQHIRECYAELVDLSRKVRKKKKKKKRIKRKRNKSTSIPMLFYNFTNKQFFQNYTCFNKSTISSTGYYLYLLLLRCNYFETLLTFATAIYFCVNVNIGAPTKFRVVLGKDNIKEEEIEERCAQLLILRDVHKGLTGMP
ncbi:hypothetical protein PMALA_076880 [Plasmodium malariae]|uniref:Uncharacterized protein n=1 Tax=Plasmodium malariae TaxID=5858 RepID=A0A1A8X9K2_PLAMA|nr:hypothetical protein PMALA_076880 [Plasmodium malariae]